jgi:hypothetical protein
MSDRLTDLRLKVTGADVAAALERDDYAGLVDNVLIPALVEFIREEHTAALVKGSTLPRSRRQAGLRLHSHHRTRRSAGFRPSSR